MRIIFELTMPNVGSWNGKFTGANNRYTVARNIHKKVAKEIEFKNYYYDFGDGWGANIEVRLPNHREKPTNLFYGYEWMIDSIISNGKISS